MTGRAGRQRRDWIAIPAAAAVGLTALTVVLAGTASVPLGLLAIPAVALAVPFLSLPVALILTALGISALSGAYYANDGTDAGLRILVEAALMAGAAIFSRYAVTRFEDQAEEVRFVARVRHAIGVNALLDRGYEEIFRELRDELPADRLAIVVQRPGTDELEVAYAAGLPVHGRATGDVAPLVEDEDGWRAIGDGRVQLLSGLNVELKSNPAFLGAGLRSGLRATLGSRADPTGYIVVRSTRSAAYRECDGDLLALVAAEVSTAIASARYRAQVVRAGEERVSRMRLDAENKALETARRKLASLNEQLEVQNAIIRESRERLLNADEAARRTIAEELHGPVQTRLFMVWHSLKEVRARLDVERPDIASLAAALDDALDQVDRVREEDIRLLSHRLHPSIVRVSALAGLMSLQEFYENTVPVVVRTTDAMRDLEPAGASRIPESIRLAVHRVADAALANVVRHADATECVIQWDYDAAAGELRLTITDDGRGFEPDARAPSGLGLVTIRDYVDAIGGQLSVTSFPGEGTGVAVVIPFALENVPGEPGSEQAGADAIGAVLNMHWAPPGPGPRPPADDHDLPFAIGE